MRLKVKLTLLFLAVAMIPLAFVSACTFHNYRASMQRTVLENLQNVAAFKADKIETYFAGLKSHIEVAQSLYNIKKNLPLLSRLGIRRSEPGFLAAKNELDNQLKRTRFLLKLANILLVNSEGQAVYSTDASGSEGVSFKVPEAEQKAFEQSKTRVTLSDVFLDPAKGHKPAMLMMAPLFGFDGSFIGVIAFEVDMSPFYILIQDRTGLGRTGETLLGKKIGNDVLFLNPLRHDPNAALKRRLRLGDPAGIPIQNAVQGRNGSGLVLDYRHKPVIAVWQYLASLQWGMVAKIDAQEAFEHITNLKKLVISTFFIVFIWAALIAFSMAQSISGPIHQLSKGAEIIGSGNMDHHIEISSKDEVGQLSSAFNKMAQDLKKSSALREIERKRLFDVLEGLPFYVVLLSEDYRVPFANKFFRERFGESYGKRCYEYLFNRTESCENCETYTVMRTGAKHHWEWAGPDGRNYDIHDFPFKDADGSRMIMEVGIDITEQKKAQEELRQASQYARTLLESSLDPLVTISADGKIMDVNEAAVKATGVARENLIGTEFSHYFTEPEKAKAGYRQVFSKGFVADYPLTLRHKDGRLMDVLYNASIYKDTQGHVLGVFAAARDITLLKQASQYARSLLESSLDPLVTISAEGKITDVNEATLKVTGLSREDLVGTDFSNYFTEPEKAKSGYEEVFSKGFVTDYPLTIRRRDGHLTDVLYNASVYKDTHGNVLGIFAAARDVTELKRAEAELRRHRDSLEVLVAERTNDLQATNKELARSNENLEQFAYVASHDLQEPLRVMSSYSQLLEKRYKDKLDQDANEFIDFIVDAAKRMQKLITDLLAYSRVGKKGLEATDVDLNKAMQKVLDGMSSALESTGGAVTYDKLPVLKAHETSMMQLFQNLIGNALKFHGPLPPKVHVSAKKGEGEWVFSVQDNGLGIDPKYHERIFQIFQRLHSKEEYSGTGIGLSICKKIVTNYGGRIWIESEQGRGSTFYFTFPTIGEKR